MRTVRVVQWGLGAMGSRMAALMAGKPGLELVGVLDTAPDRVGRDVGELLGVERWAGIVVDQPGDGKAGPLALFQRVKADVALHAVVSFAHLAWPQIRCAIEQGCNVITTAEEMAYPQAQNATLAVEIDAVAKAHGVTVLGTGVNPGFVLDTLVIALTGVCARVDYIKATRINDLSPFGPTVLQTQGVGCTPAEFEAGLRAGRIVGHIGFPESLGMIGKRLGWTFDEVRQHRKPINSCFRRETPHVVVEPGQTAGCRHTVQGIIGGRVAAELIHPQQVCPELESVETGDFIAIHGEPDINLVIQPEIPGGAATAALAVNMIPAVLDAAPGLTSMADLPVPSILPQDFVSAASAR